MASSVRQSSPLSHTHLASGLVVIACSFHNLTLLQISMADIAILIVLRIILPGIAHHFVILEASITHMPDNFTMLRTIMTHAAACFYLLRCLAPAPLILMQPLHQA